MDTELLTRLEHCARAPLMLVVADFDHSLSRSASRSNEVSVHPSALQALRALAGIPWTRTAVISRRSIRELSRILEPAGPELLVGLHGRQWMHEEVRLAPAQLSLLKRIEATVEAVSQKSERTWLERTPVSIVLNYQQAAREDMARTVGNIMAECAGHPGVFLRHGGGFVEVMVQQADRIGAFDRLRQATSASAVVYLGDPQPERELSACLGAEDVAIDARCLDLPTAAHHSLVLETAAVLTSLAKMRGRWNRSGAMEAHAE